MNTPIFYIFLFIHLISLVVGFGAVIVIDTFGLLWLLKVVDLKRVTSVAQITQVLIWIGWFGLVLSGVVLIQSKGYVDNLTKIKLFFVAMLGLNGIYLHLTKKSIEKVLDQKVIPALYKFRIALASTVSQLGWWGALTIGFLHRQVQHNIPWPNHPVYFILGIIVIIVVAGIIGEITLKEKNA